MKVMGGMLSLRSRQGSSVREGQQEKTHAGVTLRGKTRMGDGHVGVIDIETCFIHQFNQESIDKEPDDKSRSCTSVIQDLGAQQWRIQPSLERERKTSQNKSCLLPEA